MQVQHIIPALVVLGLLSIMMNVYSNFISDFLKVRGLLPESTSIRQLKHFLWWFVLPLLLLPISYALFTLSTSAPPVTTIAESTNMAPPLAQTPLPSSTSRAVPTAPVYVDISWNFGENSGQGAVYFNMCNGSSNIKGDYPGYCAIKDVANDGPIGTQGSKLQELRFDQEYRVCLVVDNIPRKPNRWTACRDFTARNDENITFNTDDLKWYGYP